MEKDERSRLEAELTLLRRMVRLLNAMPHDARARVLRFLADKFITHDGGPPAATLLVLALIAF